MALLADRPEIQTKIQEEIDDVIGRGRFPTIDDRGTLPFTEATLYEVMRYSSILPIAVPHSTTQDVEFCKFRMTKKEIFYTVFV